MAARRSAWARAVLRGFQVGMLGFTGPPLPLPQAGGELVASGLDVVFFRAVGEVGIGRESPSTTRFAGGPPPHRFATGMIAVASAAGSCLDLCCVPIAQAKAPARRRGGEKSALSGM